jgi:hypothetical protein
MKLKTLKQVLKGKHNRDVVRIFSSNPDLVFSSYEIVRSISYRNALVIIRRLVKHGILKAVKERFYQISDIYKDGRLIRYISSNYPEDYE